MGAYIFISVLIVIVSVLLGLIVLVQNSKGGGLSSSFSGQNQYMGVRKTADFLEKSTWTLAVIFLIFSLASVFVIPRNNSERLKEKSELQEMIQVLPSSDYQAPPVEE